MTRLIHIAVLMLVPTLAFANPYRKTLARAVDQLEEAEDAARDAGKACRRLDDNIEDAIDAVENLRERRGRRPTARNLFEAREAVAAVSLKASFNRCPYSVTERLEAAVGLLDDARQLLWDRGDRPGNGPNAGYAAIAPLKLAPTATFSGERAVRVSVPQLQLHGLQGQTFSLGARFRSVEGQWTAWVTTQQWSVPSNPFIWKDAFTHYFRYSTLAEVDFSDGRFVAQVAVFDGAGTMLAARETLFSVRLPRLPPAPPVVVAPQPPPPLPSFPPGTPLPPPQPGQPPQPVPPQPMPPHMGGPIVVRDCGTGADPGCTIARNGLLPMDAPTYAGFITALRANRNELSRRDICRSMFAAHSVTAVQLGTVLDHFRNELTRLEVAKIAAPRVVNPGHALVHASKFRNGLLGRDYTQLMASQR